MQHSDALRKEKNQTAKIQLGDTNELTQLLNGFNDDYLNLMEDVTEDDQKLLKQLFVGITKTLAPNLCLLDGQPIPVQSLLTEPYDEGLSEESKSWEVKASEMLDYTISTRGDILDRVRPLLKESTTVALDTKIEQLPFERDTVSDDTPMNPELAQQQKTELVGGLRLKSNVEKDTPQILAVYDHAYAIEAELNDK